MFNKILNVYPYAEKKLKRVIDILTLIGYLFGTLAGVGMGVAVSALMRAGGVDTLITVIIALAAAFVVAGILIFMVWLSGLLWWIFSNMASDVRELRKTIVKDDPEKNFSV